jgi:hypothetical protein
MVDRGCARVGVRREREREIEREAYRGGEAGS